MPGRPVSASKTKSKTKKGKKTLPKEDIIDPRQEQINELIHEREEIRSKLNILCSKIVEHVNIEKYQSDFDLTKQQPSDISIKHLLAMIDDICYYRIAFLNLYQENDDNKTLPVQNKITQLSLDKPDLFRKRLTTDQRLTFVTRERDLWKENAQLLQVMYATMVDQLEMNIFKKITPKTTDILHAHRLNLEDVCLIFSSPNVRSINDAKTLYTKTIITQEQKELQDSKQIDHTNLSADEHKDDQQINSKPKRSVSYANEVEILNDNQEIIHQPTKIDDGNNDKLNPVKPSLPSANTTLVDNMDSNLRMLIIKELSKDNYIPPPPSKMSLTYSANNVYFDSHQKPNPTRNKPAKWVELARLIGIAESEIEHWLSQSLQYPAGRVISTWCNSRSSSPTVTELHSLLSSNELNRLDLAHQIETMYYI